MIKGIIQNHVTHPYIIANISTNILSGCFLCCKQRIKEYFCMLINLTEEWAGNSISPVSLSTRFWVCLSPPTLSPCLVFVLYLCPKIVCLTLWCLLIPWKASCTYTSLPIIQLSAQEMPRQLIFVPACWAFSTACAFFICLSPRREQLFSRCVIHSTAGLYV